MKISWRSTPFYGGLAISSSPNAFFDCSTDHGDWWTPIGAKKYYTIPNTIPIGMINGNQGPEIRLWVRIPFGRLPSACRNYRKNHYYIIFNAITFVLLK